MLDDDVVSGIIGKKQAAVLRAAAVSSRMNVLVAGGNSTGKTTLGNALLAELARIPDRVILIGDTYELQCAVRNQCCCAPRTGDRPPRLEIQPGMRARQQRTRAVRDG
jgi:type IV secretion system protein TrbB